ncbi:MAG: HAD family phosphatase [Acidimicrobiia bacterium]|nr:HAD family phosphatase [Acidimicrobiia bacterium]
MPRRYQAILFDFDGVLVDSEPVHFECWNRVLAPFGLAISWDDYEAHCVGVSDRTMVQRLCDLSGKSDAFNDIWSRYAHKKQLFRERMLAEVPMPDSTRKLLKNLNGYRLAVVSSSGRTEVEPPLEAAGVWPRFETIVCGDDVTALKPDPEPYRLAAERLGIQRALVVEDSQAGLASGRAAGFDVVHVTSPATMAEQVLRALDVQPH